MRMVDGSFEEGKFVALFGRAGRLRAVMAIGRPRQLMGYRPLLQAGSSWDDALAHALLRQRLVAVCPGRRRGAALPSKRGNRATRP